MVNKQFLDNKLDDFDTGRQIAELLAPFNDADRGRILRWACEKLNMVSIAEIQPSRTPSESSQEQVISNRTAQIMDIKTFIKTKNPPSDRQLAAVVAYYYAFEAPQAERKDAINSTDLIDACRLAGVRRPKAPRQTLVNAVSSGFLDRSSVGHYKLNAIGENLVAMTLPKGNESGKYYNNKSKIRNTKKVKKQTK